MKFIKRFLTRGKTRDRVFVLGLDGVPHSLVAGPRGRRLMPNLAALFDTGVLGRMPSTLPAVSTVAWATYATGTNPGKHGVFGFVDRVPNPFTTVVPTARDLKTPTLWEILSRQGKRVGVMNVPLTYPPKQISGFMIGGFLSPDVASAVYPPELAPRLIELDYRLDVDVTLAGSDMQAFVADVHETLARRFNTAFQLMETESWDFFQLHVMATDRINHFFWGAWENKIESAVAVFEDFYRQLDAYIGELVQSLPEGTNLVVLSEHGSARGRGRVFLNHWLEENGYLIFAGGRRELKNLHPKSRAYSLVPGRIYLNLEGREERGAVPQGRPYEELREELIHRLGALTHPENGEPLVKRVHRREDLYEGPHLNRAPDLILEPAIGYDLKANLDAKELLGPPDLSGVHTHDDAFLFLPEAAGGLAEGSFNLVDVAPTIIELAEVGMPLNLDGRSLL
ncbi:MAG: alkaline phosphatase family protein [Deltaproteobacteria bacterium]|nr:alkaline phosphatase family protein [Deltaproteobacteria bacterium]